MLSAILMQIHTFFILLFLYSTNVADFVLTRNAEMFFKRKKPA